MRNIILSFFTLLMVSNFTGLDAQSIEWRTWEEVIELQQKEPRKVFIDIYTDWCGWCKKMDKATFQQPDIAKYVNENYYAIKFNAEQKEAIELGGRSYKYVASGRRGYHELAADITRGKLSFPTIVFMNDKMELIQPIPGFKDVPTFEMIMTYFGEDNHKKTPWSVYQKSYKSFINKG